MNMPLDRVDLEKSPQALPEGSQPMAESEYNAERQKSRIEKRNQTADRRNELLGGINTVKSIMNRKKIKKVREEITVLEKQKNEKNKKLGEIMKKKKTEERQLRNKLVGEMIRIVTETASVIGLPVAIWEAVTLARNNGKIKNLKKDIKKILVNIKKNDDEFRKQQGKKQVEIYNLQNVFKRQDEPE